MAVEQVSDQRLVERAKQGDNRAFDLLVLKYQSRMSSVVARYIRDHHEVADVTQEALESMFSSQDGYKKIRYIQMRHVAFIDFVDIASAVGALKEVDKSRPHFDINFAKQ